MKDFELKIEYLDIDKLTPYESNARKHQDFDVATIKNSIYEFGVCDPIGIWSDKNIIVEGHGRLLALKQLGIEKAPCIRLDHLSDEQRREYALAHNKTAEMSEWDWDKLKDELAELAEAGMDMTKFGFETSEQITEEMLDDFFVDTEGQKPKDAKKIQCPHCGEWIEI